MSCVGYRQCDIYMCRTRCVHLQQGKFEREFSNQCCCECGLRGICPNKCDMNGNNNRAMEEVK